MAKITFVDKDDKPIGAGTRQEASEKGLICRIARIFVFNSKGQLLLQKRGPNVSVPNKWDDSTAGHVDEGEEYSVAALRELQEETGLGEQDLIELKATGEWNVFYNDEGEQTRQKCFAALVNGGAQAVAGDMIDESRWVAEAEVPKALTELGLRQLFEKIKKAL